MEVVGKVIRFDAAQDIIQSRLLILQSKRLMLSSQERRLVDHDTEAGRERVQRLRAQTETAQHRYRMAILGWGSPDTADYWVMAYSRLIGMASALVSKLRDATIDLPAAERYEVASDVEMLEIILEKWTELMRSSMAGAVA